jgi:hypothetical protein
MEAVGFWPRGIEPCGRRRSGFGTPNGEDSTLCARTSPGFLYLSDNASDRILVQRSWPTISPNPLQ